MKDSAIAHSMHSTSPSIDNDELIITLSDAKVLVIETAGAAWSG